MAEKTKKPAHVNDLPLRRKKSATDQSKKVKGGRAGDVNSDGVPDMIVGAGSGAAGGHVK